MKLNVRGARNLGTMLETARHCTVVFVKSRGINSVENCRKKISDKHSKTDSAKLCDDEKHACIRIQTK